MTILHDPSPASVDEADEVASVLMTSGTEIALLEVREDLNAVVRGIGERSPDLVVNLVESSATHPRFRPDIAAALDLVGVPYSGAGPSGLHLATAPDLARRLLVSYGIGASPTRSAALRLAVVGNDRLAAFPDGEALIPLLSAAFTALRLRDYALVEVVLEPEPAIVRAFPNPPLGRKDMFAQIAADAGLKYEDLVLSIADEAWERHKEVAVSVKTA